MCYPGMKVEGSLSAPDCSLVAKRELWVHDEGEKMKSSDVIQTDGEAVKWREKGRQCQRAGADLEIPP